MPVRMGIRMTAFFLFFLTHAITFADPPAASTVTLSQLAQQRAVVAQAFQASKDEQQKVAEMEKKLGSEENASQPANENAPGESGQQAGQAATSDQLKQRLAQQQQVLQQIQDEKNQAAQNQTNDFLDQQDKIIATQVDRQQQLQQIQSQAASERQSVAQLNQTIQFQRSTNVDSPTLDDALTEYQRQKGHLDELENLEQTLATEVAEAHAEESFNQTQNSSNAKQADENLQNEYAEAEKSYQQLQESYQSALSKEDADRKGMADLKDSYLIEKEKQIALDDTYNQESKKLLQMITSFSKQ
jgi:hypothetical protein